MKNSIQKISRFLTLVTLIILASETLSAQEKMLWHNTERQIHYKPDGQSFVLVNGTRKFNRALYGTNTGFRVEAGDLPEFAMYMPGMGGNFKLGITSENESKWITEADSITTKYTPGRMEYEIKDKLFGEGKLLIQILALAEDEGFVLKINGEGLPDNVSLVWAFGGASGKKFSRDGDIGADPESVFYLQPEYCQFNEYQLKENSFLLDFGWDKKNNKYTKKLFGVFPTSDVHLGSATQLETPEMLLQSSADSLPVLVGKFRNINQKSIFWKIKRSNEIESGSQEMLAKDFERALAKVQEIGSWVEVITPDPYINTLGGAIAIAGDAIWETPAFLHGSVAWRMHLNAWRGAYVADPLGWHDRAKSHFESYGNSQVLEPASGPNVPDTLRNFARQKEEIGTAMFSRGYISRHPDNNTVAHHYDMNLVFIEQLLNHFQWTGNKEFLKEMWPVIKRHLAWEKRNFDSDNDGLYDAYAAIWASDALQYSGGGVTYSSSYNYRANKMAAKLAEINDEDPGPYRKESEKIYEAIQHELWIPEKGVFAEYKDLLGNQLLHENPGIWTIYHAIDEGVPDAEQAYQMLNYIDTEIPHIPVVAEGLEKDDLYLLSTTNWQPYTWSINNVALAENLHTALAYWQGGESEKAYKLWESSLIESMYLGASPGGFQQLSFYDAIRGELYRDFGDPIGLAARTLVEGLFGIQPNAISGTLTINPGFPKEWENASLKIPDIELSYKKNKKVDRYEIIPKFKKRMNLELEISASFESILSVKINGNETDWTTDPKSVGIPKVIIESPYQDSYKIEVTWNGNQLEEVRPEKIYSAGENLIFKTSMARIVGIKDPQEVLDKIELKNNSLNAIVKKKFGHKTFFLELNQGDMNWLQPVNFEIKPQIEVVSNNLENDNIILTLHNFNKENTKGELIFNSNGKESRQIINLKANGESAIKILAKNFVPGTNHLLFKTESGDLVELTFQNWDIKMNGDQRLETIDVSSSFNSKVTDIFMNKYLTPRPDSPTLQLPITGIGNWCYPTVMAEIDDSGLREKAGKNETIITPQGIPFKTQSKENKENIVFVSQWDNYPDEIIIPLNGKASHAYFMMAGSTNPMQSRFVNGELVINYEDGSSEVLELKNPENWWPIEQDYYTDGFAFTTDAAKPPRVYFKTGTITRNFTDFKSIKGYSNFGIDGGAGTILDIPLNTSKILKSITIKSVANEVVIGLMSLTLQR